jgi:cobalamin biosynthesis protein CobT
MNKDIFVLRETVAKLVPLLAGQGLRVTQQGSQAYVETDPKTLKPVRVNIPYIPDNATEALILAIQGFIDHEVAHILFTNWSVTAEAAKAGPRTHSLWNIVEDPFIERKMGQRFPGSVWNVKKLHEFFLENITKPALAKADSDLRRFEILCVPAARALSGQEVFQRFMDDGGYWANPFIQAITKGLKKETLALFPKIETSAECLKVAREMHDILYPPPPPAPPAPAPEPSKEKGEGEDAGEPNDKDAEDGEGKGEKEHEEDSDKASGGEASEDDADAEADEDDAGEGADGDDEDAEGADSDDGKEGEAEDDDDGDDDAGGDAGEPDDEDDGPGAEGEGDDASDQDDDAEDDADGDGASDDDDADAGDEAEDESGAGPQSDGDDGEPDDAAGSSSSGGDEDGDDASDELSDEDGEAAETTIDPKSNPFLENPAEPKDFDEQITLKIADDAARQTRGADYRIFSKDFDVIEKPKRSPGYKDEWLIQLDDKVRHMVGPMQKDIERLMAARSQVVQIPGYRSGRLHSGGLHKLMVNDDRVFRRRHENRSKDTAVGLLIDNSGSMCAGARGYGPSLDNKLGVAMAAGYALSSTLERVGIAHEVLGFTTAGYTPPPGWSLSIIQAEQARTGIRYSRTEPIYMPIYKEFEERLNPTVRSRFAQAALEQTFCAANVDGESVETALTRLLRRRESRKVLIVLSDGRPASAGAIGSDLFSHLHKVVENGTKMGVDIIGIGIMDESVKTFYPKYAVLNRLEALPGEVMGVLKRVLLA